MSASYDNYSKLCANVNSTKNLNCKFSLVYLDQSHLLANCDQLFDIVLTLPFFRISAIQPYLSISSLMISPQTAIIKSQLSGLPSFVKLTL